MLAHLTADYDGRVTSRGVSLGWFSPVEIQGLCVEDPRGGPLLQAELVRTESSLLSLLWDARNLGVVHIDKPDLAVVLRDDGSNLEDALASLLANSSASGALRGSIEVTDGSIRIVDPQRAHVAQLATMGAKVQLPSAHQAQGMVTVDRCRVTVGSQTGELAVRAQWEPGGSTSRWSLSAQIHGLGLSCVEPLMRRLGEQVRADGVLTTDFDCRWDGPQGGVQVDVRQASMAPLRLSAPRWFGADQLQMQSLHVAGSCLVRDGRWQFQRTEITCDAGRFTIDGAFAWTLRAGTGVWSRLLQSAASADLQARGQVDLAYLTRMLPSTLRIRDGAALERGTLQVRVAGTPDGEQRRWSAEIETSELAAVCDGRRFTWQEPLRANLELGLQEQGWDVRQLGCHTPFLDLTGRGASRAGSLELTCDLARLASELRQLFDFGGWQAAGTVGTRLHWQQGDAGRVTVNAASTIDNLALSTVPESTWQEPQLRAALSVEAQMDGPRCARIRTGRFELASATDRVDLRLVEPVEDPGGGAVWSIHGIVQGELARFLARARVFLPGAAAEGDGSMRLECTSRIAPGTWEVQGLVFHSEPLRLRAPQLHVDEPLVQVELDGRWDYGRHQVSVPSLSCQSSTLSLRATDIAWNRADARSQISGDLSFRADLARLHASWQAPWWPADWRAAGAARGQVSLVQRNTSTTVRWSLELAEAELARRTRTTAPRMLNVIPASASAAWQTVWKEPSLKCTGAGQYDGPQGVIQLDRCDLVAPDVLTLSTAGRIAAPLTRCEVDLTGRVTYDLARLAARLLPQSRIRVLGQDTQSFSLRGPLRQEPSSLAQEAGAAEPAAPGMLSPALTGLGSVRWQSADLLGVAVGPGLVAARLAGGTIDADALEVPVSQGMLRMVPHLHMNHDPPLLTLDAGQVLTGVNISPRMCQDWLKYVAPLAADATRAEGRFSLSVERAEIPLWQPATARLRGTLLVDSARLGPGPLAMQLIDLGQQVQAIVQGRLPASAPREPSAWVLIPQQQTRFELVDSRVYHDRCTFQVDNAVLHTRGSVGLDQSLALVVQVPIQDGWLERDKRLAVLRGMIVEVPIGGTWTRPRLDAHALEQLTTQVLRQTAKGMLEEGINRGLQELFGPRS